MSSLSIKKIAHSILLSTLIICSFTSGAVENKAVENKSVENKSALKTEKTAAVEVQVKQPQSGEQTLSSSVNINQATADEIATKLVGIGPAKARAIIDYRQANGEFKSAEEVAQVKGIGEATLKKNEGKISF